MLRLLARGLSNKQIAARARDLAEDGRATTSSTSTRRSARRPAPRRACSPCATACCPRSSPARAGAGGLPKMRRTPHDATAARSVGSRVVERGDEARCRRFRGQRRARRGPRRGRGPARGHRRLHGQLRRDPRRTWTLAPLLRGLPGGQCHCPHWGYVFKGRLTWRFADHEEVYEAGRRVLRPAGPHAAWPRPGAEFVQFSPAEELREVDAAITRGLKAMQAG